ncbi:MAG: protealysin inhibitor emfourin [Pseudonocardiaceae bacterium]
MQLRVVRRGGIAGVALEATVDTSELTDVDAARAESELSDLPWDRPAVPARYPDQFSYEVSVAGDNRTVVLREDEVPADLRPVLALLTQRGTIRPASS